MKQDEFNKIRDKYFANFKRERNVLIRKYRKIRENNYEDCILGLSLQRELLISEGVHIKTINNVLRDIAEQQGLEFKVFEYEPVGNI